MVAARIGVGAGEHPWGDTGFVLLRHPLEGEKSIFSLFVHLQREPLHPDRTRARWLRRLLLDGASRGQQKWRVMADAPTWKDEDKGRFSPANMQKDQPLRSGIYEEEDRTGHHENLYVKLEGRWIKVHPDRAAKTTVKELSPWVDFDLEAAAKKSPTIAALKDGKVAILDTDKKDGKRRWTVEAGEPIGLAGTYLGRPVVHWSVFSKDPVFPTGSMPEKEFGAKDEVKLAELDLDEERGEIAHTRKLLEALDPHKKSIGEMPQGIPKPGEVELFYRTEAECWRSRYLAVKGLSEFALDVDKFLQQERHQSHTAKEHEQFKKNVQLFLFWKDLAGADDFPQDGKAIFVHPATALRLIPALLLPSASLVVQGFFSFSPFMLADAQGAPVLVDGENGITTSAVRLGEELFLFGADGTARFDGLPPGTYHVLYPVEQNDSEASQDPAPAPVRADTAPVTVGINHLLNTGLVCSVDVKANGDNSLNITPGPVDNPSACC